VLPMGEGETGADRLMSAGIETLEDEGKIMIDNVAFDSPAQAAGLDFDQQITTVLAPQSSLPKQLMYIPALLLLGLIWFLQRGRRSSDPAHAAQMRKEESASHA